MGTATEKTSDGVQRYASVTAKITSIEDMRLLVSAYDTMKVDNPDLTVEGWDNVDSNEYMATVADY